MIEKKHDRTLRKKLLKGKLNIQTREEYMEYKKILPHQKIKGMEKLAVMMNKLEDVVKK